MNRLWDAALDALTRPLARWGVAPDGLTAASLVPAAASGLAAAQGHFIAAAILLLLSGLLDVLDGALARRTGRATRAGALLDSTLDRVADALPLVGLAVAFAPLGLAWLPALAIVTGFTVPYARARAEALGARLPFLWMRRAERLLLTAAALALADVAVPGIAITHPLTLGGLVLLVVGGFAATLNTLRIARRDLRLQDGGDAAGRPRP